MKDQKKIIDEKWHEILETSFNIDIEDKIKKLVKNQKDFKIESVCYSIKGSKHKHILEL